jgi:hypothetical protein
MLGTKASFSLQLLNGLKKVSIHYKYYPRVDDKAVYCVHRLAARVSATQGSAAVIIANVKDKNVKVKRTGSAAKAAVFTQNL